MPRAVQTFIQNTKDVFGDRLLQLLLLGVILTAFAVAFLFDNVRMAIGVLTVGGATAFIESKEYRNRKKR